MAALSAMAVTLFLGGWQAPLGVLEFVPSYVWFGAKLLLLLLGFIWIRATFPRLRIDQLTRLSWKFLVPLALVNLLNGGFWAATADWSGPAGVARWLFSALLVVVPFVALARSLAAGYGPRTYRYAPS
jgi:NADH-quinone oxidoreductase subunit H